MNCEPLLSLFLPRRCVICDKRLGKGEEHICAGCLTTLIHPTLLDPTDNEVARRIWGFHTIRAGVTLYYYKRGSEAHQLLQAMKYRGRIDVCKSMGRMLRALKNPLCFELLSRVCAIFSPLRGNWPKSKILL